MRYWSRSAQHRVCAPNVSRRHATIRSSTYDNQHHAIIEELYDRHGRDVDFRGVVIYPAASDDINDKESYGGRASLLFDPTDNLSIRLSAFAQNLNSGAGDTYLDAAAVLEGIADFRLKISDCETAGSVGLFNLQSEIANLQSLYWAVD